MKVIVENKEIFEWTLTPDQIILLDTGLELQDLVDSEFDPNDISVEQISNSYYEVVEVVNE